MSMTKQILMGSALMAVMVAPAFAAGKKEITEIVGYNVTETTVELQEPKKAALYERMDYNKDGTVTFKEYRNFSTVENEYDVFARMDKDGSKNISYEEFVTFNNTKGSTKVESELHGKAQVKGTNLKTRVISTDTKSYYVPVEPEVVNITDVEPAAK